MLLMDRRLIAAPHLRPLA